MFMQVADNLFNSVDIKWDCIIIRYSEIALKKGYVRKQFENTLVQNIARGLDKIGVTYEFKKERGRIFLFTEFDSPETLKDVCSVVQNTFGVSSCSPAVKCDGQHPKVSRPNGLSDNFQTHDKSG